MVTLLIRDFCLGSPVARWRYDVRAWERGCRVARKLWREKENLKTPLSSMIKILGKYPHSVEF
jgi:hypothetical protein